MRLLFTALACLISVSVCGQGVSSKLNYKINTFSTGKFHGVAINNNNEIVVWGSNKKGQLNIPKSLEKKKTISVSAGDFHTLALQENGEVFAWGDNKHGQCNIPNHVSDHKVVAISAGSSHNLALLENNSVITWGNLGSGKCEINTDQEIIAISAGLFGNIFLLKNGTIVTEEDSDALPPPIGLNGVVAISSGDGHSLAMTSNGKVVAWGFNSHGQCEIPDDIGKVVSISAGSTHSVALQSNGKIVTWGNKSGFGYNGATSIPGLAVNLLFNGVNSGLEKRVVNRTPSESDFIEICAGDKYSLALKRNGELVSWGIEQKDRCDVPNILLRTDPYNIDALSSNNDPTIKTINKTNISRNISINISPNLVKLAKVAVIGKESSLCNGSEDDGQDLAELVEGELLGIYGVVERRHLEKILDEQRLAMSGLLLEDSDFAQAGCLAGAQGTVLASYGCLQGKTKLQIKLVDCSTSELYWSATGFDVSEFDLMDALRIELEK